MYCPHCMKEIQRGTVTCPFCSNPTHVPTAGMATLRVSCRPHLPVWMIVLQPLNYFRGYKVHISIDGLNYVLKSKKKQLDIPVSVGTHLVRISSVSKTAAKVMKFAGTAMAFTGAVTGSGSTLYAGSALEDLGGAFSDEGIVINFDTNELLPLAVKLAWNGSIVEDTQK